MTLETAGIILLLALAFLAVCGGVYLLAARGAR
jgi:hypothetical protein